MKKYLLFMLLSCLLLSGCGLFPRNDLCEDMGLKQTDRKLIDEFYDYRYAQIECNNTNIYDVCNEIDCLEHDKWGDCTKTDYHLEIC